MLALPFAGSCILCIFYHGHCEARRQAEGGWQAPAQHSAVRTWLCWPGSFVLHSEYQPGNAAPVSSSAVPITGQTGPWMIYTTKKG